MKSIKFLEDLSSGYASRTRINASSADATLAFATDFTTAGEKCTYNAVVSAGKIYIPLPLSAFLMDSAPIVAGKLKDCHSLNIAGNGIYTLSRMGISQEECDKRVLSFISKLINDYHLNITTIRSGGQTGVDESGLKAGAALGIETICLCPKGWKFRTLQGDVCNEALFKARFENCIG